MTEQPAIPPTPPTPGSNMPVPEILGTPREPRRINRRLLVAVSGVLALGVVAGGGVWALDTLGDADRTATTVVWAEPPQGKDGAAESRKPAGLGASLLPVAYQYKLGPDIGAHGNDTVLSRKQAVAIFKEGSRGLPSAQRNKRSKAIDKLRLQGLALRSYVSLDGGLIVETKLAQIENAKNGRKLAAFQSELADALGIFRKGPAIQGFKNAKCFLMPKVSKAKLDAMFCSAYEGDVLVSMTAYGVKPLDTAAAAELLRRQLDHLNSPGEYV
ncbi:hypothetical protein NLX86_24090 [Streptomyces sp. A3M-1-3]|uniref:hypothetical protein n=1 Tax=Streptomyces sp. A3M-1-3 TaxID=2962044 RepID=UPI0020B675E0|nr:hypothetical protein [Streptomyces sp. A3M-1-3]MCP3821062.1 hypothetical protein [Streptomyces sp. A3M-1-3]